MAHNKAGEISDDEHSEVPANIDLNGEAAWIGAESDWWDQVTRDWETDRALAEASV